jgi:hypothetical protein
MANKRIPPNSNVEFDSPCKYFYCLNGGTVEVSRNYANTSVNLELQPSVYPIEFKITNVRNNTSELNVFW